MMMNDVGCDGPPCPVLLCRVLCWVPLRPKIYNISPSGPYINLRTPYTKGSLFIKGKAPRYGEFTLELWSDKAPPWS